MELNAQGRRTINPYGPIVHPGTIVFFVLATFVSAIWTPWFVPVALVVVGVVLVVTAVVLGQRAIDREHAWLSALPFVVEGYDRYLNDSWLSDSLRPTAEIDFVGALPSLEQLREVLSAHDGGGWWPKRIDKNDQDKPCILFDGLKSFASQDMTLNRDRLIRDHGHALLDGIAMTIHARFPIARIRIIR